MSKTDTALLVQEVFESLFEVIARAENCLQAAGRQLKDQSLQGVLRLHVAELQTVRDDLVRSARQMNMDGLAQQAQDAMRVLHGRSTFQHALATQDRYAILEQCHTALRQCLIGYEQASEQTLPGWLNHELARQTQVITRACLQIESMCIKAMPQLPAFMPRRASRSASAQAGVAAGLGIHAGEGFGSSQLVSA